MLGMLSPLFAIQFVGLNMIIRYYVLGSENTGFTPRDYMPLITMPMVVIAFVLIMFYII